MVRATLRLSLVLAIALFPAIAQGDHPRAATAARAPAPKRKATAVPASRGWHTKLPGQVAPVDETGRAKLVLQSLNLSEHVELSARSDHGGFAAEDLDRAAHVLREPHSGNEHPIDPHLLDLVYRVQTHFGAPEIRVISGYRTPHRHATSNHAKGRAMDLIVPGASDADVAKFAREQGFVGVGIYPVSGFVHLDVRERSFFWVDTSGPGKRNRTRGILSALAAKSDQQASARGERSVGPFHVGDDVDAVVAGGAAAAGAATGAPPAEDEDVDPVTAP
jgi:uncharacterized protein YcbK (DUF882 family)